MNMDRIRFPPNREQELQYYKQYSFGTYSIIESWQILPFAIGHSLRAKKVRPHLKEVEKTNKIPRCRFFFKIESVPSLK